MEIIGLFSGNKTAIGPKLSPTGIIKKPIEHAQVNALGIVGDVQADKRVHGGPQKALHQFSLSSYQRIIQQYPLLHRKALPGSIGENISTALMHEDNVCIGDIYQVGSATLQVSAPRIPCWKIDAKFRQPGLSQFIAQHHLSGWYYRVIAAGQLQVGDTFKLVERSNSNLTIRHFLHMLQSKKLDVESILMIENASGLDPQWQAKLLRQNQ
ncbi:MOSC domain-containing protein [Paraglaciecola hydrolytica]|uniref:Molybdenum cofactor sulfurase n=1 Tax=Paraglaciecola hydrolytica TaxID=1799789 RepID=A0A136A2Z1_9ALTE|nr:MOSC domain-containing protein [Paraglaciecola hydrolytica]KXI29619.1 molybdenum cofactor sulfurase [Paraglaciecola hydrolytica]